MNLSEDNKRLARNTVFLYFRSIFLLLIGLYTSRVTLQVLGVEDYGIYAVVGGVVALFSMFSQTLASASQRFITFTLGGKNQERLKTVFSTCITLHIVLGLIVVLLLEIAGIWFLNNELKIPHTRLGVAQWVFQVSIATFFVGVISVPFQAVLIAHEKMSAFAYISIVEGVLKLVAVFMLMFVEWDKLILYSILMFIISIINRAVYSVYSHRKFEETRDISLQIDKPLFKEMFSFAGWNLFGNGSLVLRTQGVDIVLNMFFGIVVNAAKGICNQVQNAVQILVGNFTNAMKPQLTKVIAQKNYPRTYSLINNGTRYSFILMLLLSVPIIITAPDLLELWLGVVPQYTVEFVRLTMCYLLLDTQSRMLIHAILSEGRIRNYQIIVGVTKLMAIPLVYVMLRAGMSPLAGVWANIILDIVCLAVRIWFSHKLLNLNPVSFICSVLVRCGALFAISLGLSFLFMRYVSDMFILTAVVSFVISVVAVWLIGLSRDEHRVVVDYGRKMMHLNK